MILRLAASQNMLRKWQDNLARLEWLDKAIRDTEWPGVAEFATERSTIMNSLAEDFIWLLRRSGLYPPPGLPSDAVIEVGSPLEVSENP